MWNTYITLPVTIPQENNVSKPVQLFLPIQDDCKTRKYAKPSIKIQRTAYIPNKQCDVQ